MIAGFCAHDELARMVAGGMTPHVALQTATINPARYLGRETTLGTIAVGKSADLVLLAMFLGVIVSVFLFRWNRRPGGGRLPPVTPTVSVPPVTDSSQAR